MELIKEAVLLLEDGTLFRGEGFGSRTTSVGEVVFNTGMTGYQEILTDPSYMGQMVVMTYLHIGNYGVNDDDVESAGPHVEGLIVGEVCFKPSNYRASKSVSDYLAEADLPGLHRIDTRRLTRHLREQGAMLGALSTDGTSVDKLKEQLAKHPRMEKRDLVQFVTTDAVCAWEESVATEWYYDAVKPLGKKRFKVAALDFGIKRNILRLMTSLGMDVTLFPASVSLDEIREKKPNGIFLSNGPGDPEGVGYAVETVKALLGTYPIFGICLGHQIIALATGAKTYKLMFGHHGSNHPVKRLVTGEIEITAQNHNFAVDTKSLEKAGFELTHLNLNDQTVEGMQHSELPVFSVQYHPEASPGPHDSVYLFRTFYELMKKG